MLSCTKAIYKYKEKASLEPCLVYVCLLNLENTESFNAPLYSRLWVWTLKIIGDFHI